MDIKRFFEIEFELDPEVPLCSIDIVSQLIDIPVWKIRELIEAELVQPKRIGKKKMLFCIKDLKRLEYIHYLIEEKGVNIQGVKVILEMELTDEES